MSALLSKLSTWQWTLFNRSHRLLKMRNEKIFSRSLCGPQDCLLPQCFLLFFSFFKEKWPQLLTFYLRRVTFVNSPFICFVCFLIIPQDRTQVMHFRQEHHGNDMSSVHPGRRDSRWLDSLLVMTVVVTWLKVISVRFLHC